MKLSVLDLPTDTIESKFNLYKEALEGGTRFGIGSEHEKPKSHPVMDQDWNIARITRESTYFAHSCIGQRIERPRQRDIGIDRHGGLNN